MRHRKHISCIRKTSPLLDVARFCPMADNACPNCCNCLGEKFCKNWELLALTAEVESSTWATRPLDFLLPRFYEGRKFWLQFLSQQRSSVWPFLSQKLQWYLSVPQSSIKCLERLQCSQIFSLEDLDRPCTIAAMEKFSISSAKTCR